LSSSDGQRANQFSQYGSKPIFSTVRDATFLGKAMSSTAD
jgi:hypothetical protein